MTTIHTAAIKRLRERAGMPCVEAMMDALTSVCEAACMAASIHAADGRPIDAAISARRAKEALSAAELLFLVDPAGVPASSRRLLAGARDCVEEAQRAALRAWLLR